MSSPSQMNNLSHIPAELLSSIVKHVAKRDLYACALINKQFYMTANHVLWRALLVPNHAFAIKLMTCMHESPLSLGPLVQQLCFGYLVPNNTFMQFMINTPSLKKLTIHQAQSITDGTLQYLGPHCPHLTSLDLRNCQITQQSLHALGQYCHQLKEIHLEKCHDLDAGVFAALVSCPLENLVFASCTIHGLEDRLTMKAVVMDLAKFRDLKHLEIEHFNSDFVKQIIMHTNGWLRLTHLRLEFGTNIDDTDAIGFIKTHPLLEFFGLTDSQVTNETLDAIASFLPGIKEVNLTSTLNITHHGVRRLVRCSQGQLSSVTLAYCLLEAAGFPEAPRNSLETDVDGTEYVLFLGQKVINKIRR
ncbi:hypothetical protein BCR42DRAFT_410516 [Absidia repens]|uniref:F-box domain-containing protein n=1 Tax=Absidia repens TaxID=90262 RepID=A0A1X2IP50_9FUNG|nr:hypothetical protein BCR42DRAFT_410516 [Absidia repens]